MHLRRVIAAAALAAALAAGGAASAAPQPKKIWVGTLSLTYSRIFETPVAYGTATERDVRTLTIVNRKDGTATVTGKVESSFRYPCANGTFSGRTEAWAPVGKVQPIRVSFVGNRYQLDYPNPGEQVTIEELTCTELTKRVAPVWAMNVGFQLYGKASPDATRITGEWKQRPDCSGTCKVFEWRGRWDLRLVTIPSGAGGGSGGTGGGGSGGGGSAGGSGRAGAGCEARVRNGTARDDVLRGSAAAELLRGLAGDDRVLGLAGADCLRGGAGDDALHGGLGRDLLIGDAGKDALDGGAGNDELRARDGVAETVRCGSGRDLALVDAADRVVGCETVRR